MPVCPAMPNAEIAADLFLSTGTVKGNVGDLLLKLGVANRVAAALWAVRHGVA